MSIRIESRFNGPPGSVHGGVACGVFASTVDSRLASVRLLAPPPLDQELQVVSNGGASSTVVGAEGPVASVQAWDPPQTTEDLPWLSASQIAAARAHWMDTTAPVHVFPTCFGCGHGRPDADGLELYAGQVPNTDLCATSWTPTQGLTGAPVEDWLVWAAVDCPSGAVAFGGLEPGEMMLLGELSVQISEAVLVGTEYQIVSRSSYQDGRKMFSDVAVVGSEGTNVVRGQATWIRLSPIRAGG